MQSKIVLALALIGGSSASLFTNNTESQQYMWNAFKHEYRKDYAAAEDAVRFVTFVENLKLIDQRNVKEAASGRADHAVHGITKFADLSPDEFAGRYLLTRQHAPGLLGMPKPRPGSDELVEDVEAGASSDWSGTYTTPVKDQVRRSDAARARRNRRASATRTPMDQSLTATPLSLPPPASCAL